MCGIPLDLGGDGASFLKLDPKCVLREVKETVESALQLWPAAMPELLGEKRAAALLNRLETLRLVEEVRRN